MCSRGPRFTYPDWPDGVGVIVDKLPISPGPQDRKSAVVEVGYDLTWMHRKTERMRERYMTDAS
jgi:hypothetical protein